MKRLLFAALLLMPMQAMAETVVEDAWVMLPPPVADTAAGYMIIKNTGDKEVSVVAVKTDIAESPEFHSSMMHNGMMHMQAMEKVVVPAHGEVKFKQSGNRLMLTGLKKKLQAGEHVMINLEMSDGSKVMVHAEVRDMRDGGGSEHHNMNHDHH